VIDRKNLNSFFFSGLKYIDYRFVSKAV